MRFSAIFRKCILEHVRSWVLLCTALSFTPAFILIYYAVFSTGTDSYGILLLDQDEPVDTPQGKVHASAEVRAVLAAPKKHGLPGEVKLRVVADAAEAEKLLRSRESEMLLTLPREFSASVVKVAAGEPAARVPIGMLGDLTNPRYTMTAVIASMATEGVVSALSARAPLMEYREAQLGGQRVPTFFEAAVPGLLVCAVIMLLFTAAIALVKEVENGTIVRLRMSAVRPMEYVGAVGLSETIVGVVGVGLSLLLAMGLGFDPVGSPWLAMLVAAVSSVSIVAVALVVAAVTKSANDVLIVGNFPFFLLFFLSGSAFPLPRMVLFEAAGHGFAVNEIMPATHAVVAMNKVLLQGDGLAGVAYELCAMAVLTVLYFAVGAWLFQRRHMRAN